MDNGDTFQLVMSRGPQPGQVFELPRSTISIGRDPGNQVMINDPQISRQHARVTPQGGLMIIEDLGSTNGTTVNGLRITGPHTLAHGDQVGLGDNVLLTFYGQPPPGAGATMAAPRVAPAESPPPAPAYQPPSAPSYEAAPAPVDQPYAPDYAPTAAPDYAAYPEGDYEYYEEYPEEAERNWTLIALGCVLVAIVLMLVVALAIYFGPAGIADPVADFLLGLGIDVCDIVTCTGS